jgi:hypothetical protein
MLLNEIMGVKAKDLKSLSWSDLANIIAEADGDRPSNDGKVAVKFKKASLPVSKGMWEGWGFVYEFSFKNVDGDQVTEEWVVYVNKEGQLDIRAL